MPVSQTSTFCTADNGLTIVRVDDARGGVRIALHRATDDEHRQNIYATIRLDGERTQQRWVANRNSIVARELVDAINLVDRAYANYRRAREATEQARQEERESRTERVDPHWQKVIEHFGQEPDTAD